MRINILKRDISKNVIVHEVAPFLVDRKVFICSNIIYHISFTLNIIIYKYNIFPIMGSYIIQIL